MTSTRARVLVPLGLLGLLLAAAGLAALYLGGALVFGRPLRCQRIDVLFVVADVVAERAAGLEAALTRQRVVYASLEPAGEGALVLRGVEAAQREVARKTAAEASFDVVEAGASDVRLRLRPSAVEEFGKTVAYVLERRLSMAEVEADVESAGPGRVLVELPAGVDAAGLRSGLGVRAQLEVRPVEHSSPDEGELRGRIGPPGCPGCEVLCGAETPRECHLVRREALLGSGSVKNARPSVDASGQPAVGVALNPRAAQAMREHSRANVGRRLAVILDGKLLMAPSIQSEVRDQILITGRFSRRETEELARMLRTGALPGPIRVGEPHPALARLARSLLLRFAGATALALLCLVGFVAALRAPASGETREPTPTAMPVAGRPAWLAVSEVVAALCLLGPSGAFLGFAVTAPVVTRHPYELAVMLAGVSASVLGLPLLGRLGDRWGRRRLGALGLACALAGLLAHGPLFAGWEGVPAWFGFLPAVLTAAGAATVASTTMAWLTGASGSRVFVGTLGGLGATAHTAALVAGVGATAWGAREGRTGIVLVGVGAGALVAILGLVLVSVLFFLARRVGATETPQAAGSGGWLPVLLVSAAGALAAASSGVATELAGLTDQLPGTLLLLLMAAGSAGLAIGGAIGDALEVPVRREGRDGAGHLALTGAAWIVVIAGFAVTYLLEDPRSSLVALLLAAGGAGALRGAGWGFLAVAVPERRWGAAWGGLQAAGLVGFVSGDVLGRLTARSAQASRGVALALAALAVVPLVACAIRALRRKEPSEPSPL